MEEITGLVVVDTNIFVDHLRSYQPAVEFFRKISSQPEKILFSAITETELIAGKSCNNPQVRTIVLNMLNKLTKIEVTNAIALKAGDISRTYGIAFSDSIIAATTFVHGAHLLTKNIKDFKNITELSMSAPY